MGKSFYSCNSICNYGTIKRFNPYALSLNPMLQTILIFFIILWSHVKIYVPFWDELKKA
jgi:hypothetical protein